MKKVILVYNPNAGEKTFVNSIDYIIDRFQKKDFEIYLYRIDKTKRFEKLFARVKENEKEYAKILVAGGDGTVSQVVNQIIQHNIDIPLGIYPIGTCNDFAHQFDFKNDVKEQTGILLQDKSSLVDVGMINNRAFINVASFGSLVSTGQRVDNNQKAIWGSWAYYFKALEELVDMKPIKVNIQTQNEVISEDIFFMLIMNGKSAGGFSKIANHALISDGMFDIVIMKKCSFTKYPKVWLDIISGNDANNKNIIYTKADKIQISCSQDVIVDIDGERGPGFPLDITILNKRLQVITSN